MKVRISEFKFGVLNSLSFFVDYWLTDIEPPPKHVLFYTRESEDLSRIRVLECEINSFEELGDLKTVFSRSLDVHKKQVKENKLRQQWELLKQLEEE